MVTIDQISKGAAAYFETEFCQKATGAGKFAAYFMLPSVPGIVKGKFNQFRASPFLSDLINPDGLVDLEAAKARAAAAMQHTGSVDVAGFRLDASDVDKLYKYIKEA